MRRADIVAAVHESPPPLSFIPGFEQNILFCSSLFITKIEPLFFASEINMETYICSK